MTMSLARGRSSVTLLALVDAHCSRQAGPISHPMRDEDGDFSGQCTCTLVFAFPTRAISNRNGQNFMSAGPGIILISRRGLIILFRAREEKTLAWMRKLLEGGFSWTPPACDYCDFRERFLRERLALRPPSGWTDWEKPISHRGW
ncbi:uncharacterized protein K489DRAFT_254440 [Dissoconium aciculare CBS 342.82]|uniref:Uncharacterized protein n=1 Tax=Dissoconium aciculare CBS 342.82 TaxID=1314786 RepID=A0A6J3M459_9PEZI|nr:uncharacterized protein K489DRAFT_254440 [Dissoconium aciculare CBS 342.82]KAF1821702.1 hypothetical protein K489DRAFT_254440 [Dissoconium aciculare CBS 342.82]